MITMNPLEAAEIAIQGFGAMQKVPELAAMLDVVNSGNPKVIMEIGCGKGGTAWCWSKLSSVELLILVDLPGGPWGGMKAGEMDTILERMQSNTNAKIVYIKGNSQNKECVDAVNLALLSNDGTLRQVDVLVIDGAHDLYGVTADYDLYKNLVREGGLITFHDVVAHPPESGCEVHTLWEKLKEDLPSDHYCEFIADDEAPWGGWGVIKTSKKEQEHENMQAM